MRRRITGFSNPTIKAIRALRDKKHRRREGKFLAEGLRLLIDARDAGRLPEALLMADGREPHPLLDALEAEVRAAGGEVLEMPSELLAKVTGKDNPQAVAGVFADISIVMADLDRHAAPLWLVAHALRDPGNLGTMLRTADAVGAGGLILIDDCADPFSVEAVRASMGAVFTVPLAHARWDTFVAWLRQGAGQLVAASLRDAEPYRAAAYVAPCFVLVGNESRGLPEAYEAACDLRVTIPMLGRADSLNAAIAAAVLAYEALARLNRR
jgi:TrmH family RNA methyltransferase